jgi:Tat protein translocase TatC
MKRPAPESDPRMTFGEHLQELRRRLLKSLFGILLAMGVALVFHESLTWLVARPHIQAMGWLGIRPPPVLITRDPKDPLLALLKLVLLVGLFGSAPWIGHQMWGFVSAGLKPREKREVRIFAPVSYLLFLAGTGFGFAVLAPYLLYGLAKYVNPRIVAPVYGFREYLDFVTMVTIVQGAIFQIPLLMVFLARVGLLAPRLYSRFRRPAILANVVLAAVLSPPDPVSLLFIAAPLLALYEVGVFLSSRFGPPNLPGGRAGAAAA